MSSYYCTKRFSKVRSCYRTSEFGENFCWQHREAQDEEEDDYMPHYKGPILSNEKMRAMSEGEQYRRQEGARMSGLRQDQRTPCDCDKKEDHVYDLFD